jgi:hypothetical protein
MAMTLERLLLLRRPGRDGREEERQLENAAATAAIRLLLCLFGSSPPTGTRKLEAEQEEIRMWRRRSLVSDQWLIFRMDPHRAVERNRATSVPR